MADLTQAYDALKKADAAGNAADAKSLADYIRSASPPGKENSTDAAAQRSKDIGAANIAASQDEHGPVTDAMQFAGGLLPGAGKNFSDIGSMVAHPINTAKAIPGAIGNLAGKAGQAVMHPVDTTQKVGDYLKNLKPRQAGETVGGMLAGGAAGKAAGVLGDVVGPSVKALVGKPVSQEIRDLAAKGVVTTPGQRGGTSSWRDTAEQKLQSLAVGGQSITNRRAEAVTKWSSEKLDDALKDAGAKPVPPNMKGLDSYFHTHQELQNRYNSLLPKMTGDLHNAAGGPSLGTELAQIRQTGLQKGSGIRPTDRARLASIIDNDVLDRFDAGGKANGDALKQIQDVLGKEIGKYGKGNVSERNVSEQLEKVQASVNQMLRRENPKLAGELKQIDKGYAKYQTALKASDIGGVTQEGAFTPNQYLRSIKQRDQSKNRNKFGTGAAPGQKEALSASKILGNTVPNSGTPERLELLKLVKNPWQAVGAFPGVVTPILYSKPVQKFLQNRALKKGGPYTPIGNGAPIAGAAVGAGSIDQNGIGQ